MKCLEKDRTRRYESASGLGRDVEHYLADEPVEACPPSASYRLRKLARKHRTPLRVAGTFLLLLVLGVIASAWQAIRATVAERAARESEKAAQERKREADDARGQAEKRRDELAMLNEVLRRTHYVADINLARVAWDENDLALTHELLERYRPRAGQPDLRGFEWDYLDRLARGGQLRIDAHAGGVTSVAFMPDGKRLISAGFTQPPRRLFSSKGTAGAVKLWDAATGRPLPLPLDGPCDTVVAMALSSDGTRLAATRGDQTVQVWELATGSRVTLEGPPGRIAHSVNFSPDGKRLVSLYGPGEYGSRVGSGRMEVWDLAARKPVVTVDRLDRTVQGASFSPDGKQLVIFIHLPQAVTVYDAETGREAFSSKVPEGSAYMTGALFSPDGKRLATCDDQATRILDVATHETVATWPCESPHFHALAYSADGRLLARGGIEGFVEIWDTGTGRKVQTIKGHAGSIHALAFSPDGARLATAGADGTLRLWDLSGPQDAASISGRESRLKSVIPDLSPDGRSLVTVEQRGVVRRRIELWDTASRRVRWGPIELPRWWLGNYWSGDGARLYLADEGKTIHVVETASGQVVRRFQVDAEPEQYVIALSPDERWLVHSGPGGTIRVRDARTGAEIRTIRGFADQPQALAFVPGGSRLLGIDVSGNLTLWDFATGREVVATTLAGLYVFTVRFSRDGTRVAVLGNRFGLMSGEARILDAGNAREVWSLRGHTLTVTDADFSPDGRRLVTASGDRTVRIWDLGTGQEILKLSGDPLVTTVRFVSGGRRLIGGSMDRTIRVWDASPLPE
jgi:WD40 repeat protein